MLVAAFPWVWTDLFSNDPDVLAAASAHLRWVGPAFGVFGFGLTLYFAAQGSGRVAGPVEERRQGADPQGQRQDQGRAAVGADPAVVSERAYTRGRDQVGTLGSGNHFLELQADADGALWLMLHSGSRGMGQAITAWHLARAARPASVSIASSGAE